MEIADVITHAMRFPTLTLSVSLSPAAGGGAGANPGGSPGGSGGFGGEDGPRGTSGSSKKVNLGGDGELVSSPPSFSGVSVGADVPSLPSRTQPLSTHADQMRC